MAQQLGLGFIALRSVPAGQYPLETELGRGGRAATYLAREVQRSEFRDEFWRRRPRLQANRGVESFTAAHERAHHIASEIDTAVASRRKPEAARPAPRA
jgi:hypothetical protein